MQHLAVIMDGNGRWAERLGLKRAEGHRAGAEALAEAVNDFVTLPLDYLSVYAFSMENNTRNAEEIGSILGIIADFLLSEIIPLAQKYGLKIRFIGNGAYMTDELVSAVSRAEKVLAGNSGKTLVIALEYGGLDEICRAANKLVSQKKEINGDTLRGALDTAGIPDPDAVLRYGGYRRLSNFMPVQTAYSELFFINKYWPEYRRSDFLNVIEEFGSIKRNFGGLEK
jgi:undecaprenyl diphosphate synthase